MSKACFFANCTVAAACWFISPAARGGFVPLVTKDAVQPAQDPQDNFEEELQGNQTSQFTGQFLNPFAAPNSVNVSYDPTSNLTTVQFAGQPIPGNTAAFQTVGFAINAVTGAIGGPVINPNEKDGYWTPGVTVPGHVPEQNMMAQYLPATNQIVVTISNDPQTFSLFSVGYMMRSIPFPLDKLNRTNLPPSKFIRAPIPDGTVLTPGESVSFTISGVHPGAYVTLFSDARFSGDSSGNPYTELSGSWLEFQAVHLPEPSSWLMMVIATAPILYLGLKRNRARTT
jgi:hypothetical protein